MKFIIFLFLMIPYIPLNAEFLLIRIENPNEIDIENLRKNNFEFAKSINNSIEILAEKIEYEHLIMDNFRHKIIISNLEQYISTKLKKMVSNPQLMDNEYFRLGSMSGYFKVDEIYSEFDRMMEKYPQYISKSTIGYSIENRPIHCYAIGKNDSNQILITSLTHAREPGTIFTVLYYFWDLFKKFDNDDSNSAFILNNHKILVIPLVNPDGVYFNEVQFPDGGGLWRKNRRVVGTAFGVDINRNYGPNYAWNAPNEGSSLNPAQSTYRGDSAFSEPETRAVRDLIEKSKIRIACNFHTYGNAVFYPYSYLGKECQDSLWYRGFLLDNYRNTRYIFGIDNDVINYPTRGSADDYMYLGNSYFDPIASMTCEIGNRVFEFWPPIDTILNYANLNIKLIDNLIFSTQKNISLYDYDLVNLDGKFYIKTVLQNIGLSAIKNTKITFESKDNKVKIIDNIFNIPELIPSDTISVLWEFVPGNTRNGEIAEFSATVDFDYKKVLALSIPVFQFKEIDLMAMDLIKNWRLDGEWNFNDDDGFYTLSSNREPNYLQNSNSKATFLVPNIDGKINRTSLRFNHKISIEANYDFGTVWLEDNYGKFYNLQFGDDLVRGINLENSKQADTLMGFQGEFKFPKPQNLYLTYNDTLPTKITFNLLSDNGLNKKGWKITNLRLRYFQDISLSAENNRKQTDKNIIIKHSEFALSINSITDLGNSNICIFDYMGRSVMSYESEINSGSQLINIECLSTGFYTLLITTQNQQFHYSFIIAK